MIKILPLNKFRLLKEWSKRFTITDDTVIAYAGVIYSNKELYPDLVAHEMKHLEQQKLYGLDEFTRRYLNDKKFRLEMERQAYFAQLASIDDEGLREAVKLDCIEALCSGLYGTISKQEAEKLLTPKVKSNVDSLIGL